MHQMMKKILRRITERMRRARLNLSYRIYMAMMADHVASHASAVIEAELHERIPQQSTTYSLATHTQAEVARLQRERTEEYKKLRAMIAAINQRLDDQDKRLRCIERGMVSGSHIPQNRHDGAGDI